MNFLWISSTFLKNIFLKCPNFEKNGFKKRFEFPEKKMLGADPANLSLSFSRDRLTIYEKLFHPIICSESSLFNDRLTVLKVKFYCIVMQTISIFIGLMKKVSWCVLNPFRNSRQLYSFSGFGRSLNNKKYLFIL